MKEYRYSPWLPLVLLPMWYVGLTEYDPLRLPTLSGSSEGLSVAILAVCIVTTLNICVLLTLKFTIDGDTLARYAPGQRTRTIQLSRSSVRFPGGRSIGQNLNTSCVVSDGEDTITLRFGLVGYRDAIDTINQRVGWNVPDYLSR